MSRFAAARRSVLAACLLCALAAVEVQAARLTDAEKRTLELSPGVVLVMVRYEMDVNVTTRDGPRLDRGVKYYESGSGFLYRPDGYVLTNDHVVMHAIAAVRSDEQARKDLIAEMDATLKAKYNGLPFEVVRLSAQPLTVYLANGASFPAEIRSHSDPLMWGGKDIAILKIEATNLPTLTLGNSEDVHMQEPIMAIGYPAAASSLDLVNPQSVLVPTVTLGSVSAVTKRDVQGTPLIQADVAIGHGNSGGPALNARAEVIGISTYRMNEPGFSFFVPINIAKEFVREVGAAPQAGLFNKLWSEALNSYSNGHYRAAINGFTDVLHIMPNLPDAERLVADAEAQEAMHPASSFARDNGALLFGILFAIVGAGFLVWYWRARNVTRAAVAKAPVSAKISRAQPVLAEPVNPPNAVKASPVRVSSQPLNVNAPPASARLNGAGTIQVTKGSLAGQRFRVTKDGLLVGRNPAKCQISFSEDTVSGEHAWIVPLDGGVAVIDRGSTNGTYINSTDSPRVSKIFLKDGDRVYLGKQGAPELTFFSS